MKRQGRVLEEFLRPKRIALEVSLLFGRGLPLLEKKVLIRKGKPVASGYRKVYL